MTRDSANILAVLIRSFVQCAFLTESVRGGAEAVARSRGQWHFARIIDARLKILRCTQVHPFKLHFLFSTVA